MRRLAVTLCAILWAGPSPAAEPTPDALRYGTIATHAMLCGLRDNDWARDLRSAEIQALTKTMPPNDAVATLGFAEDEAMESFAEAAPPKTCGPLGDSPDLKNADEIVKKFRQGAKV